MERCGICRRFSNATIPVCPECGDFYPVKSMGFKLTRTGENDVVLEVPYGWSVMVCEKGSRKEIFRYHAPAKRKEQGIRAAAVKGLRKIAGRLGK